MKKYTKTYEWVSLHGTDATIGISNHAQELETSFTLIRRVSVKQ